MKLLLTQFASYHLWANQLLTDKIRELAPELQTAELKSSYGSLHATVMHIWDAESAWWQRMKLSENVLIPSENFKGNFADAAYGLMQQSKQWQDWIVNSHEHVFDHEFIYQTSKKEKFKQPVYQVVLHVFNHGTYHRGQLVNMLRQLEVGNIPQTDFVVWSRKKYG
jgi:uncharacterized damage-inducible protein DinB